jgi:hypothetical protein
MSDTSQGPGWWLANDGKWYPREQHPDFVARASAPTFVSNAGESKSANAAGVALMAHIRDPAAPRDRDNRIILSSLDFHDLVIVGEEIRDVTFSDDRVASASFTYRNDFRRTTFVNCKFRGASLSGVDLRNATFEWCDFRFATLRSVWCAEATFDRCDFFQAKLLDESEFSRARIIDCSLNEVDFQGARLAPENLLRRKPSGRYVRGLLQQEYDTFNTFHVDWRARRPGEAADPQEHYPDDAAIQEFAAAHYTEAESI